MREKGVKNSQKSRSTPVVVDSDMGAESKNCRVSTDISLLVVPQHALALGINQGASWDDCNDFVWPVHQDS